MQIVWPFFLGNCFGYFSKTWANFFPNFRSPWFNNRFDVKVKRKSSDVLSHKKIYARNLQFYKFFILVLHFRWGLEAVHDTQHNDTHYNDIQHNNTQHNDTQHNNTQHNGSVVSMSVVYAECHLCWVRHKTVCRLCWVSFMLSVTYAECNVQALYAECHLCWVSFMLSVTYAECDI